MQKLAGISQDEVKFGKSNLDFGPIVAANKIKPHFAETKVFEPIIGDPYSTSILTLLDQQRPLSEDNNCITVIDQIDTMFPLNYL